MINTSFVELDNYGFVKSAYISMEKADGHIPAPENVILSDLFDSMYYFEDGYWKSLGKRPLGNFWVPDKEAKKWFFSLDLAKSHQWTLIKRSREAAINAPLVTPYGTFDSDPKSRQNITDAILMLKSLEDLGSPTTIDFTLADDTARTLTTAEMVMVGLLLGQKIQAAHAQARALRGALDLATTKEEVEAITWQATT